MSLEAPKVSLASLANKGYADLNVLIQAIQLSGGLNPGSPVHTQVLGMLSKMHTSRADLDQAVADLDQATLGNYAGALVLLTQARSLVAQGLALLPDLKQQARHLPLANHAARPYEQRLGVFVDISTLSQLGQAVFADAHLTNAERSNLSNQINADLISLGRLNRCLALFGSQSCQSQLKAFEDLDGLLLIRPKTEIILGGADARSAINELSALVPILQIDINNAAAAHKNVSALNAMLSDMSSQLAGASADIAPIDSQLEPMTFGPGVRNHDMTVMQGAIGALADANKRLTAAKSDATQILSAVA
jgi:hypothetical protein